MHELAQEQRIAAGLLVAGGAEGVVGIGQTASRSEAGGGLRAEGSGLHDRGERVGEQLAHEARVGSRLLGPKTDDHPGLEPLHPRQEVGQPPKRQQVAPVQVVDREQEARAGGDVGRQPVQAVQRRQRRVGGRGGRELGGIEQRRREPRRVAEQLGSFLFGQGREERLEELADHAVREGVLELAAACSEDLHPGRLAR